MEHRPAPGTTPCAAHQKGNRPVARPTETLKACIRAKVEHPYDITTNRFGLKKVRYCGLAKNTALLMTPFSLANVMIANRRLPEFCAQGVS